MIRIIGISHCFQRRPFLAMRDDGPIDDRRDLIKLFYPYLNEAVRKLVPDAICEEYSKAQVDAAPGGAVSVAEDVARSQGIEHVFCDPDEEERTVLFSRHNTTCAVDTERGWPVREGEWIARMMDRWQSELPNKRILFLCGANHVKTFTAKLQAVGLSPSVYCADLQDEWKQEEIRNGSAAHSDG